jgi:spoIIIJ-associated protein
MKSVETEGKTTEGDPESMRGTACFAEDLEVEVLSGGSSGFLGLGVKNAKIRATVKEISAPRTPSEARPSAAPSDSQAAETAKRTLQDILRLLEVEATVDLKEDSERILLDIRGDGSGLSSGAGQTLDARD